jgi:cytochrome c oxidase subunit 2
MLTSLLAQGFMLPPGASTFVEDYAWLWDFIWIITLIFVVLNASLMVLFVALYRQKNRADRDKKPHGIHHSTILEIGWSLPPLIVVIAIFGWGFRGYMDMITMPQHGQEIVVTAWKWGWQFTYPNGVQDGNLYLPAGEDVTFILESQDVIHSFYIPQARIKKDCVPGRYNKTWMHPVWDDDSPLIQDWTLQKADPEKGKEEVVVRAMVLDVYCTEYCGTGHSVMRVKCIVMQPEDYETWMAIAENWKEGLSPVEIGERLYQVKACNTCHSLDGSSGNGPSWLNLYGNPHPIPGVDVADEAYLREAILYPGRQLVPGWGNVMPVISFQEGEVSALIEFIKRQSDAYTGDERASGDGSAASDETGVVTSVPEAETNVDDRSGATGRVQEEGPEPDDEGAGAPRNDEPTPSEAI